MRPEFFLTFPVQPEPIALRAVMAAVHWLRETHGIEAVLTRCKYMDADCYGLTIMRPEDWDIPRCDAFIKETCKYAQDKFDEIVESGNESV